MRPWFFFAAAEIVGLVCAVVLWRSRASTWRKILWTSVVFVPVLGPLFYVAIGGGHAPSRQDRDMDVPDFALAAQSDVDDAGGHGGGGHHS